MKKLILAVVAATALSGCIAVPVYDSGHGRYYGRPRAAVFVPAPLAFYGHPDRGH